VIDVENTTSTPDSGCSTPLVPARGSLPGRVTWLRLSMCQPAEARSWCQLAFKLYQSAGLELIGRGITGPAGISVGGGGGASRSISHAGATAMAVSAGLRIQPYAAPLIDVGGATTWPPSPRMSRPGPRRRLASLRGTWLPGGQRK